MLTEPEHVQTRAARNDDGGRTRRVRDHRSTWSAYEHESATR